MAELTGVKKLRRIQLGRETTAGTEVNATATWRGTGTIEDVTVVSFPAEDVGRYPGTTRSYVAGEMGRLTMDETPATFEQILHVFDAGINASTADRDGDSGGYRYTYVFPTTVSDTLMTYTIEAGDNIEEEQMLYSFVEHFTLSGAPGEAVMLSADWIGQQVSTGTFTSTCADTLLEVEEVLFTKGKLYIDHDTFTGGVATTQAQATWLEFTMDVKTGWQPVTTADGALYFTYIKNIGPEIMLDLVLEHNATSLAEVKDTWKTQEGKLIRMTFEGSTFTTTGTSFTKHTLRVDLAGKFEKVEKIGERAGNDVLEATFKGAYSKDANAGAGKYATILAVVQGSAIQ
jgi:hypothetical protein